MRPVIILTQYIVRFIFPVSPHVVSSSIFSHNISVPSAFGTHLSLKGVRLNKA